MPPIPLHIEDPISPTKAKELAPQAQSDEAFTTATAPTSTKQGYPAARPGGAAVPAPTSSIPKPQPQPTRTRNVVERADLPAPPQPGAVPVPTASAYMPTPPDQAQWSVPQHNYAPTHSTEPSAGSRVGTGPTMINLGPVTAAPATAAPVAAHPPGYQQNVYAQELSSQQRASLDVQQAQEKQEQPFGDLSAPQATETAENVWNAVKAFGSKVSEGAAKVHGDVWKILDNKT